MALVERLCFKPTTEPPISTQIVSFHAQLDAEIAYGDTAG